VDLGQYKIGKRQGLKPGRSLGQLAAAIATLWLGMAAPSLALLRPEVRDPFLANPLMDEPRDPLLPKPPIPRPLSPLERLYLKDDLDELNRVAKVLLAAGETEAAYETWMREVRLRRLLGLDAELAAIQRVGERVWAAGRSQDIQLLTARLEVIRDGLLTAPSPDNAMLVRVARGFATLGEPDDAIGVYRVLVADARAAGDGERYQDYTETIGTLQTDWFQFLDAAATYEELADWIATVDQPGLEVPYLKAAIANYKDARNWTAAIATQQRLLKIYQQLEQYEPMPTLQQSIGDHYQILNQPAAAVPYYQSAYQQAIVLEQFDQARQIIDSLVVLYRQLDRLEDVVYLYQQQLLVERQSYDAYGLMDTFDHLGQTYELLEQPQQALNAYREGLVLAQHLNHRQPYFVEQIQRLSPDATPLPANGSADGDGDSETGGNERPQIEIKPTDQPANASDWQI
jgi:tetratricopeptide (TPR) repeat protein